MQRGRGKEGSKGLTLQEKFDPPPFLQNFVFNSLITELDSEHIQFQAYGDDLVMLITSYDMFCIRGRAEKAVNYQSC